MINNILHGKTHCTSIDVHGAEIMSGSLLTAEIPGHASGPWSFLKAAGESLGFCAIGVARAGEVSQSARDVFERWIGLGYHAGLAYMEKWSDARIDTAHHGIVDGSAAVVCAALPYSRGAVETGIWKSVAAHARSKDYHQVMGDRLGGIVRAIHARFPGTISRVFVDTAPVMERTWAVAAGLGGLGKNGALIVPGVGSRVVLGEIVCSNVPEPQHVEVASVRGPCLECGACVDACPTGALAASGIIDCNRCVSYHTIENTRTPIPSDVSSAMTLIFGCDLCIDACPLNRVANRCELDPPSDRGPDSMTPQDVSEASDEILAAMFRGTCLERTSIETIRRNARLLVEAN